MFCVNGCPLAVIEAKRPNLSGNPNKSMVEMRYYGNDQKSGSLNEIPNLFAYSQLLLSISGTDGRYGTTKTPKKFWATWSEEEIEEAHFSKIKNAALPDNSEQTLSGKPKAVCRSL